MQIDTFTSVTLAFAMSLLAGCSTGGVDGNSGGDGSRGRCFRSASNWRALVSPQPRGPARLIVVGEVEVTSTGCRPELVFKALDKSQPPGLILELTVHAPDKNSDDDPAITRKEVRFESTEHTAVGRVTIRDPKGRRHVAPIVNNVFAGCDGAHQGYSNDTGSTSTATRSPFASPPCSRTVASTRWSGGAFAEVMTIWLRW